MGKPLSGVGSSTAIRIGMWLDRSTDNIIKGGWQGGSAGAPIW